MNKPVIIQAILEKLREEFDTRQTSSKLVRSNGNDAESKAEGKYDTRSTEENYLADGLARQALVAVEAANAFEKMPLVVFGPEDPIDLGALVELEFPDAREWFLLAPAGGGTEVEVDGTVITVLTPESPLGAQISGQKKGGVTQSPKTKIRSIE